MTVTQEPTIAPLAAVTLDLYRDIHKGIRSELFAVTEAAGQTNAADRSARVALGQRVDGLCTFLQNHAHHEDRVVQPVLETTLPEIAEVIATAHPVIEARVETLRAFAQDTVDVARGTERHTIHHLYLELASFTGAYLDHQNFEERVLMPSLEAAIGVEAVVDLHQAIVGGMPPAELASGLAVMLPAMNVDDRSELLGGIRAGAPAEVFSGVWSLAGSVLSATDLAEVAGRLAITN